MTKILLVDDHSVVRRGLRDILQEELVDVSFLEAANAEEALCHVIDDHVDLVVLDITLPGRTGLDFLTDLKRAKNDVPVLVLSMHPEERYAVRALSAGAAGYLTKDGAPEEVAKAARKILDGGLYISARAAEELAENLVNPAAYYLHKTLSNREFEVMQLIARGHTVTEIGQRLSLSVKTISTYRHRLMKKMGMRTSSQLTAYAIRQGLVD